MELRIKILIQRYANFTCTLFNSRLISGARPSACSANRMKRKFNHMRFGGVIWRSTLPVLQVQQTFLINCLLSLLPH